MKNAMANAKGTLPRKSNPITFADIAETLKRNRYIMIILAATFLFRLYTAKTMWVIPDEGNWLYDALLAMKGYAPLVDYNSRSVFYIYSLIPFVKIFGNTIFAGRLLSVIAETVSAYFIFRIARLLYGKRAGLVAAAIFGIAPFGVFFGSMLKSQTYQILFVVIALYFLVEWAGRRKDSLLFISGIFFGIPLLVRESAAIFLVFLPLFFYLGLRMSFLETAKKTSIVAAGVFLAVLPFVIFALLAPHLYGLFPPTALVSSPFSAEGISHFIENRAGMASFFLKEAIYLIAPAILFWAFLAKKHLGAKFPMRLFIAAVMLFGLAYFSSDAYAYIYMSNPLGLPLPALAVSAILFALMSVASIFILKSESVSIINSSHSFSAAFVAFMGAPVIFYLFYWEWSLDYFLEFMPMLSVSAAVFLLSVLNSRRRTGEMLLVLLMGAAIFTQALHAYQPYTQAKGMDKFNSEETVQEVATYISANTADSDEIFSNTAFAFEAGRRIIFDISHAMMYHYNSTVSDAAAMRSLGYPTVSGIISYLDDKKIRYVVVDAGFRETYFSINPQLEKYIYSNYHVEKEINGVKIYARNKEDIL